FLRQPPNQRSMRLTAIASIMMLAASADTRGAEEQNQPSSCTASVEQSPQRGAEDGWIRPFNGKTLAGWEGDPQFWRVEDGIITGETTAEKPTKGNTFLIWRGG